MSSQEVDDVVDAWVQISGGSPEAFFRFHRNAIQPRNWAGTIRAGGVELTVLPRDARALSDDERERLDRNLNTMLAVAEGEAVDSESGLSSGSSDRIDRTVQMLVTEVLSALRRHRPRRYRAMAAETASLRGRLDVTQTELLQLRRPTRSASRWVELTDDVPELQFLKGVLISARPQVKPATRRRVEGLLVELESVRPATQLYAARRSVDVGRVSPAWKRSIELAGDILEGRVGGLFRGSVAGVGEVTYLPDLFEAFVAEVARRLLRACTVRSQVDLRPGRWTLHGGAQINASSFRLDLDISKGHRVLIADTKWKKLSPSQYALGVVASDVQQMVAYSVIRRAAVVALIYPWMGDEGPFETAPYLSVGAGGATRLYVSCLPLLRPDVVRATEQMVAELERLL